MFERQEVKNQGRDEERRKQQAVCVYVRLRKDSETKKG